MSGHAGSQNFAFSSSVIKDGLVSYLDATSSLLSSSYGVAGNNANWYSIIGANGDLVNSPIYSISGSGSLNFDGNTRYVNLGTPVSLELYNNFSISTWFNSTSSVASGQAAFIVSKDYSTGARGFGIGLTKNFGASGQSYLEVNGGPVICNTGTVYSNDNKWHNMTLTVNSGTWTLYVDGVSIGYASPSAPTANSSANWYIGGRAYVGFFNGFPGLISQVLIYNRALSSGEVVTLYSGSKARFGL
jgi:hypothetical protein